MKLDPLAEDFRSFNLLAWFSVALLAIYLLISFNLDHPLLQWDDPKRLFWRTACYSLAIIIMPITNLIRYLHVRLGQTSLGHKTAKQRYRAALLVSFTLMHLIGFLGILMFLAGDNYNTPIILMGMAILGSYLYRPKIQEYQSIITALKDNSTKDSV